MANFEANDKYGQRQPRIADLEQMRKQMESERRLIRLQEVRAESKNIARKIRNDVAAEQARQLRTLDAIKAQELNCWRSQMMAQHNHDYCEAVFQVGTAHYAAKEENERAAADERRIRGGGGLYEQPTGCKCCKKMRPHQPCCSQNAENQCNTMNRPVCVCACTQTPASTAQCFTAQAAMPQLSVNNNNKRVVCLCHDKARRQQQTAPARKSAEIASAANNLTAQAAKLHLPVNYNKRVICHCHEKKKHTAPASTSAEVRSESISSGIRALRKEGQVVRESANVVAESIISDILDHRKEGHTAPPKVSSEVCSESISSGILDSSSTSSTLSSCSDEETTTRKSQKPSQQNCQTTTIFLDVNEDSDDWMSITMPSEIKDTHAKSNRQFSRVVRQSPPKSPCYAVPQPLPTVQRNASPTVQRTASPTTDIPGKTTQKKGTRLSTTMKKVPKKKVTPIKAAPARPSLVQAARESAMRNAPIKKPPAKKTPAKKTSKKGSDAIAKGPAAKCTKDQPRRSITYDDEVPAAKVPTSKKPTSPTKAAVRKPLFTQVSELMVRNANMQLTHNTPQSSQLATTSHPSAQSPQTSPKSSPRRSPNRSRKRSPNRSPNRSPKRSPNRSRKRSPNRSPNRAQRRSGSSPVGSSVQTKSRSTSKSPRKSSENPSSTATAATQTLCSAVPPVDGEAGSSELGRVQYYDYSNKYAREYAQPSGVVERLAPTDGHQPNAMEQACIEKVVRAAKEKDLDRLREKSEERGQRALEREQVRRDCETLTQKLESLTRQNPQLLPNDATLVPPYRFVDQAARCEVKLNAAVEELLMRPAVITCPEIAQRKRSSMSQKAPAAARGVAEDLNVGEPRRHKPLSNQTPSTDSCCSILLGYVEDQSQQVRNDLTEYETRGPASDQEKKAKLKQLLERIEKLRAALMAELKSGDVSPNAGSVQEMFDSISAMRKERDSILSATQPTKKPPVSDEVGGTQKAGKRASTSKRQRNGSPKKTERDTLLEAKIREICQLLTSNYSEDAAMSKSAAPGTSKEATLHAVAQISVQGKTTKRDSDKTKTAKLAKSPRRVQTQQPSGSSQLRKPPPKKCTSTGVGKQPRPTTKVAPQERAQEDSSTRPPDLRQTSYDSNSTSYRSLPPALSNALATHMSGPQGPHTLPADRRQMPSEDDNTRMRNDDTWQGEGEEGEGEAGAGEEGAGQEDDCEEGGGEECPCEEGEKDGDSSGRTTPCGTRIHPLVAHYVQRLLGMSRNSVVALGISSSDVETPTSSLVNSPSNLRPCIEDLGLTQERLERVQHFIDENRSFVNEMEQTLISQNNNLSMDTSLRAFEEIWKQRLKHKGAKKAKEATAQSAQPLATARGSSKVVAGRRAKIGPDRITPRQCGQVGGPAKVFVSGSQHREPTSSQGSAEHGQKLITPVSTQISADAGSQLRGPQEPIGSLGQFRGNVSVESGGPPSSQRVVGRDSQQTNLGPSQKFIGSGSQQRSTGSSQKVVGSGSQQRGPGASQGVEGSDSQQRGPGWSQGIVVGSGSQVRGPGLSQGVEGSDRQLRGPETSQVVEGSERQLRGPVFAVHDSKIGSDTPTRERSNVGYLGSVKTHGRGWQHRKQRLSKAPLANRLITTTTEDDHRVRSSESSQEAERRETIVESWSQPRGPESSQGVEGSDSQQRGPGWSQGVVGSSGQLPGPGSSQSGVGSGGSQPRGYLAQRRGSPLKQPATSNQTVHDYGEEGGGAYHGEVEGAFQREVPSSSKNVVASGSQLTGPGSSVQSGGKLSHAGVSREGAVGSGKPIASSHGSGSQVAPTQSGIGSGASQRSTQIREIADHDARVQHWHDDGGAAGVPSGSGFGQHGPLPRSRGDLPPERGSAEWQPPRPMSTPKQGQPSRSVERVDSQDQLERYAQLTTNCTQRIAELTELINKVRMEKQRLLETTASSISDNGPNSTEYYDLPDGRRQRAEQYERDRDAYCEARPPSPAFCRRVVICSPPPPPCAPLEKDKVTGRSHDSGIGQSRPTTAQDQYPDVDPCATGSMSLSYASTSQSHSSSHPQQQHRTRTRPPPSLRRFSPQLVDEDYVHELSTILEVDTPGTAHANASAQMTMPTEQTYGAFDADVNCEYPPIAPVTFPTFEQYAQQMNLDLSQLDPELSMRIQCEFEELMAALRDSNGGLNIMPQHFPSLSLYLQNATMVNIAQSDVANSPEVLHDLIECLRVANLSAQAFPTHQEYMQHMGASSSSQDCFIDSASLENLTENFNCPDPCDSTPINIETEVSRRNIVRRTYRRDAGREQPSSSSGSSEGSKLKQMLNRAGLGTGLESGVDKLSSSTDNASGELDRELNDLGISWAMTMRNKSKRVEEHSEGTSIITTTTSTNMSRSGAISPPAPKTLREKPPKREDDDNKSAEIVNGRPLNLRDFLAKELLKHTNSSGSTTTNTDDSLCSQFLHSIIGEFSPGISPRSANTGAAPASNAVDRQKTSTPVFSRTTQSESHTTFSSSTNLFSGESRLSSVHFNEGSSSSPGMSRSGAGVGRKGKNSASPTKKQPH